MTFTESIVSYLAFSFRNIMSNKMFTVIEKYCSGNVLDVGGAWFYSFARKRKLRIDTWTSLDVDETRLGDVFDSRHKVVVGDGCDMKFLDASFDTVVNSQVLEHVVEPLKMVSEISRVLKPGGIAIFLIPQTACIHSLPYCYYNFTVYWVYEAMKRNNLEVVEEYKLGGVWSTFFFRYIYFFLQAFRVKGFTSDEYKRNKLFYILFPFMVLYSIVSIPVVAIFMLGDLKEEPNNHLFVARKR